MSTSVPSALQLAEIPGIGRIGAAELTGEAGVDMTRFPTAAHLVSWAKFAPAVHESAGTKKQKRRPKGNPWLAATLGNAAGSQTRSRTFLGARTGASPGGGARARPSSRSATAS